MTKTYCDSCGEEIKDYEITEIHLTSNTRAPKMIDLCVPCSNDFYILNETLLNTRKRK